MATYLYNPSKPKAKKATAKPKKNEKNAKNAKKAVGGFNLTPLISALLLAGIRLSLEKKKGANGTNCTKDKKITDERKSSKAKRRPRTV
jgi:hypothetical protein